MSCELLRSTTFCTWFAEGKWERSAQSSHTLGWSQQEANQVLLQERNTGIAGASQTEHMDLETDNHSPLRGRVGFSGSETTVSPRPWPWAITSIALHVPGVRQETNSFPILQGPRESLGPGININGVYHSN